MKHKDRPQIPIETPERKWMNIEADKPVRAPILGNRGNLTEAEFQARRSKRAMILSIIGFTIATAALLLTIFRH